MTTPATILIVDDDVKNRRLLEMLLKPEGYATISVADGPAALAAVLDNQVDLILLDVMMPGISGYVVAETLKANPLTRSIPIIMLTARVDRETRLAALASGVEDFLSKPVDRSELWLRVRNLLRLKEYADYLAHYSADLELKVAERAADLQRFRLAMDATADAIYLVSRTTMGYVEFNATAERMLGYSRAELLALSPAVVCGLASVEIEEMFDAVIEAGAPRELEIDVTRKDGSVFPALIQMHARHVNDDWIIVGVLTDITERNAAQDRLQQLAHYDSLTGLPNRALFNETLRKTTSFAEHHGWQIAVMFLDVDHFKNINDTMGHAAGDELLGQVAERLVHCVRIRDTVGRLGGDEFALILVIDKPDGASSVAKEIRRSLRQPFRIGNQDVLVTVSIGITIHPDDATDPETLIQYADTAMYRAKQAGRDTFRFFTTQMNTDLIARMGLERALREAVDEQQFVLHYQPKVQLSTGRIVGVEALLRWDRPGHGLVPPNDFIPVLESMGAIAEVGSWVIAEAARQIAAWSRTDVGPVRVAVNVSARQFVEGDVDGDVGGALLANGIDARLLELELTETSLMANTERTIATLRKLKARGVQLSVDDFGTGYSCLAYLRHFPIDKLKIDVAFVRNVTDNADDAAIATTIIRMAHSLKLEVIAEGVETSAQLSFLLRQGCDQIQGYLVSRPLPAAALEDLLRAGCPLSEGSRAADAARTTLLVVGADLAAVSAVVSVIEPDAYRVFTAGSADEGLDVLARHHVHVVLCDDGVPAVDGAEFFHQVKELHPGPLRILLADADDSAAVIRGVNRGGIHAFLAKPCVDDVLREQLREAFKHYRLMRELPSMRPPIDVRRRESALSAPSLVVSTGADAQHEFTGQHVVKLYDDDADLADLVSGYVSEGLRDGESAIVVATEAHIRDFDAALLARGVDVDTAHADGQLVTLDAADMLARFMTPAGPDARTFGDVIGGVVRAEAAKGRGVRIYGEMVALLWDSQQVRAAIELESLWNDLRREVTFTLVCAYPTSAVTGASLADALSCVTELHSAVVANDVPMLDAS
jgi:diguanylate cyclase (GGDEF)-like protein/PAS domain S-box-containing protein